MIRHLTGLLLVIAAGVGCSRGSERPLTASPASPTATVSADSAVTFVGGVSGPMDVLFPGRNDSFQFRNDLEAKYQQMGRGATSTFVDREGAVIWIQEYLRYRVNGCDHPTAESKVFSQIDGGPVPATCFVACEYGLSPTAATIEYTPASLSFQVRPNPGGFAGRATSDAAWLTFA